jgi:glycerol kinase
MTDYIVAIDQGTTSSRALVFDRSARVIAMAQQEFPQIYPQPGWVEHDPEAIWHTQRDMLQQAVREARLKPEQIAAIGITNQRETTVVWDRKTGEPVFNAIVWQCRRTAAMCDQLKREGYDQVIQRKTGLVTDAYFSGTKVAWILDNVDGARERAERGELAFGTIDTFLIWRLTDGAHHVTDVSNASRTLLFNIHTLDWDDEILAKLRIPRALLPQVLPSSAAPGAHFGQTRLLGGSIPICGVAGDQQAATFGQACLQPGLAKNTYGTGTFLLMNTGGAAVTSHNQMLTTIAWQIGAAPVQYALEGSVFVAGAAVQWLRDELKLIGTSSESEAVAGTVANTGGVYVVPAFTGLGAPYWNPYARGTITGMTRGTNRAHIVRATLESVAYQTRDVVEAMSADSGLRLQALRVDGGMVRNNFLMQFQADILGVPVQRPTITETTALGAAYLAGLSAGLWQTPEALAASWRVERTFEPRMSADQRGALYAGWQHAVAQAQA